MSTPAAPPTRGPSLAAIGSVVSIGVGVLTAAFLLLPGIKPEPPPATTKGEIVAISAGESTLRTKTFTASVQIDGYKGRRCRLTATLFDAKTLTSAGPSYVDPPAFDMKPEAQVDRASVSVAVKPPKTGEYFLRFILYDDRGTELHRLDGAKFLWIALPG